MKQLSGGFRKSGDKFPLAQALQTTGPDLFAPPSPPARDQTASFATIHRQQWSLGCRLCCRCRLHEPATRTEWAIGGDAAAYGGARKAMQLVTDHHQHASNGPPGDRHST